MTTLRIENLGQIKRAELTFGDLTVLVGPQATGKSIALQLLKLIVDTGQVQEEMNKYGLDWDHSLPAFLDIYFGEGMGSIWKEGSSTIEWDGNAFDLLQVAKRRRKGKEESLFFIPAQRVLALRDGWPSPFTAYSAGDPFSVREFSEKLRVLLEREFGGSGNLFPRPNRLKNEFRILLQRHVFSNFHLRVDKVRSQKRLVLGASQGKEPLPYMVWSAGQREFVPLLLGLYWLMPPARVATRNGIQWVVLEELEMGLHSRAISVVLLLVLELIKRGYRVCLSTHSPQVLDAVWALRNLQAHSAQANDVLDLFGAEHTQALQAMASTILEKELRVFYFDRGSGTTKDISNLDPSADSEEESEWGGLSEFSGRANRAVARAAANAHLEPRR